LTRARTFIGWEIKSLDKKSLYRTTDISYITYIVSKGLGRAKTTSAAAATLPSRRWVRFTEQVSPANAALGRLLGLPFAQASGA
jgi:hypothetical protein